MSTMQYFSKPITEIIKARTSIRTYDPKALDEKEKKNLDNYINTIDAPFTGSTRFKIVDNAAAINDNIKLGTYGVIKGASSFIASAVGPGEFNLEELGYKLERIILYATSLGIGTCWLGGTFKKGEFSKAMKLEEGEILPIISPIGYKSESKSIVEKLMRKAAGSSNRRNWVDIFFDGSFDKKLTPEEGGNFKDALEMLRLAPSASNKQPWRLVKDKSTFHFYLYHAKGYSNSLGFDMQRIDMGIAMCHFDLVLKEAGIFGKFKELEPSIKEPNDNYEYIISWVLE
ncbi:nitroreductase family protein [Candidatus Clostridium stratigraminis]|uniref:Nitroreductase family protein n=1 Tax=Candidatus Clostridium stratigraminis TaxID=3381661 RepID=A0ABW8T7M4_9CLOT